ncbi:MAG: hypothetical protein H6Q69_975 [Firmicutes bacterium]|nr:hypothetical protein [Bacillota bacterium]
MDFNEMNSRTENEIKIDANEVQPISKKPRKPRKKIVPAKLDTRENLEARKIELEQIIADAKSEIKSIDMALSELKRVSELTEEQKMALILEALNGRRDAGKKV